MLTNTLKERHRHALLVFECDHHPHSHYQGCPGLQHRAGYGIPPSSIEIFIHHISPVSILFHVFSHLSFLVSGRFLRYRHCGDAHQDRDIGRAGENIVLLKVLRLRFLQSFSLQSRRLRRGCGTRRMGRRGVGRRVLDGVSQPPLFTFTPYLYVVIVLPQRYTDSLLGFLPNR
jgi:hypothetical protein